jgi:hypothetical protein
MCNLENFSSLYTSLVLDLQVLKEAKLSIKLRMRNALSRVLFLIVH